MAQPDKAQKRNNPAMAILLIVVIVGAGFFLFKRLNHPSKGLEQAISDMDDKAVASWVDYGIDYEKLNMGGDQYTPLYLAAQNDMTDSVKLFLDHGASPNTPNYLGETPLMVACDQLDVDMVKALLDKGADVNVVVKKNGETALVNAAKSSNIETKQVHQKHPDVSKAGSEAASEESNREVIIKMLLDKKADPNLGGIRGVPAIMLITDSPKSVQALLDAGAKPDVTDKDGRTLLFSLALDKPLAEKIISAGVNVNTKSKSGETALMYGVDADVATVLLSHGADPNALDSQHQSVLWHMAILGAKAGPKIDVLLSHGAKADVSNAQGETLMHYVGSRTDHADLEKVFAKHGVQAVYVDPNSRPKHFKGGAPG